MGVFVCDFVWSLGFLVEHPHRTHGSKVKVPCQVLLICRGREESAKDKGRTRPSGSLGTLTVA